MVIAIFNRRATNVLIMLLLTASGVLVSCGLPGGLYLLLPVILVALISGVLNAWYFLLPPPSAQG